jgi:Putative MetA-pathway of phenol degradation
VSAGRGGAPPRGGRRAGLALLTALVIGAACPKALAQGEAPDAASGPAGCERSFHVARPVPPECLGPIDTDRPHKTDTPHTVAAGHVQLEVGLFEHAFERRSSRGDEFTPGNNIYKLGLADRLGPVKHWDLQVLHAPGSYAMHEHRFRRSQELMVRSKVNLIEGPVALTLVPAFIAPLARDARPEGGGFVFVGGDLPFDVDYEVNAGALSESEPGPGGRRRAVAIAAFALTRRLVGPLSGFVELYGEATTLAPPRPTSTVDGGLLLLVDKNWQFDAGAYVGLSGDAPAVTPFVGLSSRI